MIPYLTQRVLLNSVIIVVSVIIDQISKILVEQNLQFQTIIPVFPSFALYRTWNEGVAFSFLDGFGPWPLVVLALVVIGVVLWLWRSSDPERWCLNLGYGLIIGGAIGNVIDRAIYGHVVDFFLVYYGDWSFAVFNLADSFISIGAALIVIDELFLSKKTRNR